MDLDDRKQKRDKEGLLNQALENDDWSTAAALDPVKTAQYQAVMSNARKLPLDKIKTSVQFMMSLSACWRGSPT